MDATFEILEARLMLDGNPVALPQVIDDGDGGFVASGTWAEVAEGFDGDQLRSDGGGSSASWSFADLTPGYQYRVSATWSADAALSGSARYAVVNQVTDQVRRMLGVVSVEQTVAPDDFADAGAMWEDLGGLYLVEGTTLSIQLLGAADGAVAADAVRIQRVGNWVPPVGVPAPQFGIDETHWTYAQPQYTYDYGNGPEPYRIGDSGPYTHYVDNTHPQATDSSNPLGTPTRPRMTIPANVPAGSVVEIRGGTYDYASTVTFSGTGTAAAPIFYRGASRTSPAVFAGMEGEIDGRYIIVENVLFDGDCLYPTGRPDHVAMRHLEVRNYDPSGFSTALGSTGTDLVIYDVHVHHNGDYASSSEDDVHGTKPRGQRIWVVDSHIHHNGGDSVQVKGDGNDADDAEYIYVGRNVLHEDRENAVDVKGSRHVIVSENVMYGYSPTTGDGSDGVAIVGAHEGAELGWFLLNEVYDSYRGIRVNDSIHTVAYVIGNVFHDIGDIAVYTYYTSTMHVVNNVIYSVDTGFDGGGSGSDYHLINNIIVNAATHMDADGNSQSESHHNLFYNDSGQVRIRWDGQTYYSVADFQATGQGLGSLESDPMFVSAAGDDFRLQNGPPFSPAIDAGASVQQYVDLFANLYGLDIGVDIAGVARPQGAGMDMGAFEAGDSQTDPNTPPVAQPLAVSTQEDAAVSGTLTATDTDGDDLVFSLYTGPAHGVAEVAGDGGFTYAPQADWYGTDSFSFRAFDGLAYSAPATVTVTVSGVGDGPTAIQDWAWVAMDTPVTVNVLNNDSNPDGDTLTVVGFTQSACGSLADNGDGSFTYTPAAGWEGLDRFDYTLSEGNGGTDSAAVSIIVSVPGPWSNQDIGPVAATGGVDYQAGSFFVDGSGGDIGGSVDEFHYVYQTLLGDGEICAQVLSVENTYAWAKAGLMIRQTLADDSANVLMAITPEMGTTLQSRDAAGANTSYTDPLDGASAPYWLKLVRSGDTFSGYKSSDGVTWTLLDAATIPMGESVHVGLAVSSLNDGVLCSAEFAHVNVSGSAANLAPVAVDDSAVTSQATPVAIEVLGNDTDPEGAQLTVYDYTEPSHGTVTDNGDGSLTYTPDVGWQGTDVFTYTVSDGGAIATATVTITVEGGLDPTPGDANCDGVVDVLDLCVLANNFGQSDRTWSQGDFDGDGTVDVLDLTILAQHFI